MDKDLRTIGLVSRTPLVLVAGATSPTSVPDLIAQAKANPGKLSHGSAGIGSISHIVAKALAQADAFGVAERARRVPFVRALRIELH